MPERKIFIKHAFILSLLFCLLNNSIAFAAYPSSSNYKIQEYSFGSGGTKNSTSSSFGLSGIAGEVEFGKQVSSNFKIGSGLTYIMKAAVPSAPTFTNPSNNYERLKFTINTIGNASDTTYALQISTDSAFLSDVNYVKSTNTIGPTLTTSDFQKYATWGGASGAYLTGLTSNTTYYLRVKARQGNYTESEYGPSASATTSVPSLTFSVSSSSATFNNLNASNAYTDATKSTILTTSTNAYNGYVINARSTGPLTSPASVTIADYTSPNSAPTTWSGNGFGYTTNDSSLTGGTADRFTNGGPKYAGFTTSSPGDPVADHPGPVISSISDDAFTISYKVQTSNIQKAASYTTTVLYIVVPSY